MSVHDDILVSLNYAITQNSGSLVYLSGSTYVSASVYKEYGLQQQYQTQDTGYDQQYLNFSVMAVWNDISDWGLTPKKSKVTLDGTDYLVGGVVTYTLPYAWITLRFYDSSI